MGSDSDIVNASLSLIIIALLTTRKLILFSKQPLIARIPIRLWEPHRLLDIVEHVGKEVVLLLRVLALERRVLALERRVPALERLDRDLLHIEIVLVVLVQRERERREAGAGTTSARSPPSR
ncbi:hypothetical protein EVJ58_g6797 [Rhodofomes roseus]|uniref:Uncharacterized protein n=1 Tax=Rhodofomes roseus TaxID=34475 RepID=A0A4Y9Y8B8_9APHY|nr:hypothetical protein EVJ58_g6797 [Rhodofomes roseus]